jgi:hypothetical protein
MTAQVVTSRPGRTRNYWPGLVLANGCKLIECLGRMASCRHYEWIVECTCGTRFTAANNQFIRTCLCEACMAKRSASPWSVGAAVPGGVIVALHSRDKVHRVTWRCRCDCGAEYLTTSRHFTEKHRNGCAACSKKWRDEKKPRQCVLCEGMSWRVNGIRCKGKGCGLRFAHEDALRVEDFGGMKSSAGRCVDAALEKSG